MKDLTVLDNIIIGRVEPHIYAFTTNTIPNYLKVGDTYRPVSIRLKEWKDHYPQLKKEFERTAKVNEDTYFRDYSVHKFLEEKRHKVRLLPTDLSEGIYYSKEFFRDTVAADVEEAINDISRDYSENTQEYQYYNAQSHLPETMSYARTESYSTRPNQQEAIDNFKKAIAAGRTNLLMYAVMRFGKSFTSMCCAVEMGARLVVVVSAKADVLKEWQKTVQSHIKFEKYEFLTSKSLEENHSVITDTLNTGKRAVVFLTLQDLQGEHIKDRHRDIFGQDIDLLLIDETHFGARAEKYGEVLKSNNYTKDIKNKRDSDDYIEIEEAENQLKVLSTRVRIHLSGTPYRILMGSEFKKEDIIAFCQFTDIVQAQEEWDKKYVLDDNIKEWDNPYYGFPQMVRFAFNPNESSRKRLAELKKNGTTYAFSALLKPQTVKKDAAGKHKKFVYEQEILDLLEVIDGSKDDAELLGFLDYDKIKDGKMCRHIVMVLPYCASCDAMEALIKTNAHRFRNLGEYEIVNISGVDNPNKYKSTNDIKSAIRQCEENNQKTITLTVNRMLTGSTVEYWDTMLFLKDTASPQEYDQAIYRLQNPYIKNYIDDDGNTIKYNMKPQTLLVDFAPDRMFVMQEQKSMIYNVNIDEAGNSKLDERLKEELRISPIVVLNKDKIIEVNATDILQKISDYQKDKGIKEEALEIPADLSITNIPTLRAVMESQNEIGSGAGFSTSAHENKNDEDEDDGVLNVPDAEMDSSGNENSNVNNTDSGNNTGSEDTSLRKKIQSYYTRILLFAFITNDRVKSIADIISVYDTLDNTRIAEHLGLDKSVLTLLSENINKFILSKLDYKIQDLNDLSQATEMEPHEKAQVAVSKFGKIGPAIVITPSSICKDMVNLLPEDVLKNIGKSGNKLLDIAGTSGEFAVALYDRLSALGVDKQVIANAIYTIPKSSICYELTRKLYQMLGLNVENIATFYAEQMIEVKDGSGKVDYDKLVSSITQKKPFNTITLQDIVTEGEEKVKFEAIVGNPPYQEEGKNNGRKPPIYNHFMDISYKSASRAVLITPARFLFDAGQTARDWNMKMLNDEHLRVVLYEPNATNIFAYSDIKGGVAVTLRDCYCKQPKIGTFTAYPELNSILLKVKGYDDSQKFLLSIISSQGIYRFSDLLFKEHPEVVNASGEGTGAKIVSKIVEALPQIFESEPIHNVEYVRLLAKTSSGRVFKFIKRKYLQENPYIDTYNVLLPESNGKGAFDVFSTPLVVSPKEGATDTFISIGTFDTESSAVNVLKYIKTRFVRALLGVKKVTQHNPKATWEYVPLQDFTENADIDWTKSIEEIDEQLFVKYSLSPEEIAFIKSMIKPME